MARVFTDAISDTDEARQRPALARAGIVMFVGFLFRRQQDWIVGFTKYDPKEVAACCRRLVQQGVWIEDDKLACLWMEAATATKRIPKRRQFELGLAFWMDGMVAAGDMTRETRDGEFHYGLPEWR